MSARTEETTASSNVVKESTIRMMTRLAIEHNAVNLSQGFPNEAPPWEMRLALAHGVLTGEPIGSGMDVETLQKSLIEKIAMGQQDGIVLDQLNQ